MRRDAQAQIATTRETVVGFSMSGFGALPTGRLVRRRTTPGRGVEVMASKTSRSVRAEIKWLPKTADNIVDDRQIVNMAMAFQGVDVVVTRSMVG